MAKRLRRKVNDFVGMRFGKLVVLEFDHLGKIGKYWKCQCDCGNICTVPTVNLGRVGRPTTSCGCYGQNVARKYKVNESYFAKIDSEDKAYWLGFIYADGNIRKDERSFQMALQRCDRHHLEKFLDSIESTHPIFYHSVGADGITIKNKEFCKNLVLAGIMPKKSYIIHPPRLPNHLQRHFWRGVLDGDGGLSSKHNNQYIGIAGNEWTCNGFRQFLLDNKIPTKANVRRYNMGISNFTVYGKNIAILVAQLLYDGANIFLDRKMEIYKSLEGS